MKKNIVKTADTKLVPIEEVDEDRGVEVTINDDSLMDLQAQAEYEFDPEVVQ